jgi:hypothetical protein
MPFIGVWLYESPTNQGTQKEMNKAWVIHRN